MNIVMNLVLALQILTALVMIGLVLIQHGKGADMGASFGSGASGSLFGATGSANFLSRSTAVCAAVFFVCTLALAYSANDRPKRDDAAACSTGRRRARRRADRGVGRRGDPRRRERRADRARAAADRGAERACRRIRSGCDSAEVELARLEFQVARRAIPHASRAAEFECRRRGEIGRHAILRG